MVMFRVPFPPNIANKTVHWARRNAWKREYWRLMTACAAMYRRGLRFNDYQVPPPPDVPWSKVTITGHLACYNPMDDDNAMARMKFLLDWLVKNGYLKDDSRKHVTWTGLPTQSIERGSPNITLDITPVETTTSEVPTSGRKKRAPKPRRQP